VGRDTELEMLHASWREGFRGVVALVGLGGAGKTALAARFLEDLLTADDAPRPDGLFVWSFYQQPDTGLFLQEAYHYFARGAAPPAKGAGILHLLHDALAVGGPHLLVLDGLERVQRQESSGAYGQIEDPLLKGLLSRLSEANSRTTVLVTSRFPLTDLATFQTRTYRLVELGGLDSAAAQALLRYRGVEGHDATLMALVDAYGAHALTLDHLGGVIGQFLGGDARRAPEAPALGPPGSDRQALRLARLLRAYEEHLPPPELALLCRLCLLRRSVTEEQIGQLFLCAPSVHARTIRELRSQVARLSGLKEVSAQEMRDLAEDIARFIEGALAAGPIAGPEGAIRNEVLKAAQAILDQPPGVNEAELMELVRLYAVADLDVQTDQRPLSAGDRDALRYMHARWLELRGRAVLPTQQTLNPALQQAFDALGWKRQASRPPEEFHPDDTIYAVRRFENTLRFLNGKHFALRRIRDLCQFYQRKWSLAGPLAPLDAAGLSEVLEALVGRHLAIREADGSFSIHPAVRDHFYRLAIAGEQHGWHDVLREQMVSLVQQPGLRLPHDRATLDLIEEAIFHALQARRTHEAEWLYREVLGGMRHLAWKLGEMARGLRILRGFESCPDPTALVWFLRALGEFEEAYAKHAMPYFRADIRMLQGRLPEVAAEEDDTRSATAAFLMGRTKDLPPDILGCAIPRFQLQLYLGQFDAVVRSTGLESLYNHIGLEGDRARHRLLLAEAARRRADMDACRKHLEGAAQWILHSGSVEHMCLLHLTQARASRDSGELAGARRTVEEGLRLAQRCGLRLYHISLLCEQAEVFLREGDATASEAAAREALAQASAEDCQFQWGAAEATHLVGQALAARGDDQAAYEVLRTALGLRQNLGDPRFAQTERLLVRIRKK
jgi:hypothetical protein